MHLRVLGGRRLNEKSRKASHDMSTGDRYPHCSEIVLIGTIGIVVPTV
jgi:hypothetical protein